MREIDESKTDQRKVFEFFLDAAMDQEKIFSLQAENAEKEATGSALSRLLT